MSAVFTCEEMRNAQRTMTKTVFEQFLKVFKGFFDKENEKKGLKQGPKSF